METAKLHELNQALMNIRNQMNAEEKEETLDEYIEQLDQQIEETENTLTDKRWEIWHDISTRIMELSEKIRERRSDALPFLEDLMIRIETHLEEPQPS